MSAAAQQSATSREALVTVRGLTKRFPVYRGFLRRQRIGEVTAVDHVDLDIRQGETLGCVGESGSGKSTLGRLILALIDADEGEVFLDGEQVLGRTPQDMRRFRRDMQIVFQDPLHSLNPRRTIFENVARPLANFNFSAAETRARVAEVLALVRMDAKHASRYPHELSGGQCQRIGIARALALSPRFIFLDEPVSALDVSVQAQILNLLKELQAKLGLTYLFVSHDLNIVRHFSDRTLTLYHGRVVEIGGSREVFDMPMHPYTQTLQSAVLHDESGDEWEQVALRSAKALAQAEALGGPEVDDPESCNYRSLCLSRFGRCETKRPHVKAVSDGRHVACHLYEEERADLTG